MSAIVSELLCRNGLKFTGVLKSIIRFFHGSPFDTRIGKWGGRYIRTCEGKSEEQECDLLKFV